ncbi:MAG: type III pantothenate kinase [Acidobacteria bacterium]|nr:type III pantothenate kinase [Acidobacteriota bacterium]
MLLAIDIGNSAIKFAIYEAEGLLHRFSVATWRDYSPEELFFDRLKYVEQRFVRIDLVMVASVVPELNHTLTKASKDLFKVTPVFIDADYDMGMPIKYDPPEHAGADRLIGAFAARHKHGSPLVICSIGTALVVDAVNAEGEYIGGVIAPGPRLLAESLHTHTALLPMVQPKRPEKIVGENTEDAVTSGVYYGSATMAEGLISLVKRELSEQGSSNISPKIVLTGGYGQMMIDDLSMIDVYEENLVLDGLRILADRIINKDNAASNSQ